jgi:hypothetical protein
MKINRPSEKESADFNTARFSDGIFAGAVQDAGETWAWLCNVIMQMLAARQRLPKAV